MRFPVTSIALGRREKSQEERKSNKTRTIHEAQMPLDVIETMCFCALMWTKWLEEQGTPALTERHGHTGNLPENYIHNSVWIRPPVPCLQSNCGLLFSMHAQRLQLGERRTIHPALMDTLFPHVSHHCLNYRPSWKRDVASSLGESETTPSVQTPVYCTPHTANNKHAGLKAQT